MDFHICFNFYRNISICENGKDKDLILHERQEHRYMNPKLTAVQVAFGEIMVF